MTMLGFCKLTILAVHPLLATPMHFEVHRIPCFYCQQALRDNVANIVKAEADTGLALTLRCQYERH